MRRQRFAYTLPVQDDFPIPFEEDDPGNIFQANYPIQDPMWHQMLAPPELDPAVPYFLYQYPVIQIPQDRFQSANSVLSFQNFQLLNHFGNFHDFGAQIPIEFDNQANSLTPISDSGFADGNVPELYAPEEPASQIQFDPYVVDVPQELSNTYPMVTSYGTVTILLRHLVRVDIAADRSVFLTNLPAECVAVVNSEGDRSGLVHPNGRVFHDQDDVHMATLDKKANISRRGVIFTSSVHCLSFLVDASGTKTTSNRFRDLHQPDFIDLIFGEDGSESALNQCSAMAQGSVHKTFRNGDEVWIVAGIRIKQDQWGNVKMTRYHGRMVVQASPTTGRVSVATHDVEMTVGRYHDNYFVVRKGNQHVSASLKGFNVQSGTQRAGLNRNGKLVIK